MFTQSESLTLIVGADIHAVHALGLNHESLVSKTANYLTVLNHEGNLVRADFENCLRPPSHVTESWIEEAGVMHPELPDKRVIRKHLRSKPRWHPHGFPRCENVE